jgi:hypothetical protein
MNTKVLAAMLMVGMMIGGIMWVALEVNAETSTVDVWVYAHIAEMAESYPMNTTFPTNEKDLNNGYLFPNGPDPTEGMIFAPCKWTFTLTPELGASAESLINPMSLDKSGQCVVHLYMSDLSTVEPFPAGAPMEITVTATIKAGGTVIGTGSDMKTLSGEVQMYEMKFPPAVDTVTENLIMEITWGSNTLNGYSWGAVFHSGEKYPVGFSLPVIMTVDKNSTTSDDMPSENATGGSSNGGTGGSLGSGNASGGNDEPVSSDGATGNDGTGDQTPTDGTGAESKTSGFEALLLIGAIGVAMFLLRRKK